MHANFSFFMNLSPLSFTFPIFSPSLFRRRENWEYVVVHVCTLMVRGTDRLSGMSALLVFGTRLDVRAGRR